MMKELKTKLKKNYINIFLLVAIMVGFATTYALANTKTITIEAQLVNVRTGPMLSYNVMGQLHQGQKLQVIKEQNGWYLIRLDGDKIGWIASWLTNANEIDSSTNTIGIINTDNVNVRQYASTESKILLQLKKGEKVNVVYSKNSWSQIIIDSKVGWISNKLFDITDSQEENEHDALENIYVVEPGTPLHSTSNSNSTTITSLKQKDKLKVLGSKGEYYQVRTNNNITGFVASKYVTTEIPPDNSHIVRPDELSKATIVIDPGHGGNDPGANANDNVHVEKTYSLAFANSLKERLEQKGAKVIMSRNDDSFISLEDRVKLTNKTKPNAFISIHIDSSQRPNEASGMTTYYYSEKKDLKLAKALAAQFNDLKIPNRETAFGDFQVLRDSFYPGVLIEIGYINNDSDYEQISSSKYRAKVCDKIIDGLENYFK